MRGIGADIGVLALRPQQVSDKLQLNRIAKNHVWKVEPSCATTGEGIFEGLSWLSANVKPARNKVPRARKSASAKRRNCLSHSNARPRSFNEGYPHAKVNSVKKLMNAEHEAFAMAEQALMLAER